MNARILIAIVALLAAGLALRTLLADPAPAPDDSGSRAGAASREAPAPDTLAGPDTGAPGATDAREAVSDAEVAAPEAAGEAPVAEEDDDRARIVGRLLLPSGEPAAGAALKVHGWGANSDREAKYGVPDDWEDPTGESGADGRFVIAFDAPRAFQFVLDANLAGHAELSWRWSELLPGSTTDVGEQTFVQACTIAGRVVDQDGEPTGIRWTVYGESIVGAQGEGSDQTRVYAQASRETGRFELTGLPPGPVTLTAHSNAANWIDGPAVEAKLGETVEADIVYSGPDLGSTITIRTFCRPFYTHTDPVDGRIVARGAGGAEYVAAKISGSSQSYRIRDVPPGMYTVEVESVVHEPWSKAGVQPGDTLDARLTGGARVALTVVDAETSEPVEAYRARVRLDTSNSRPNEFTVVDFDDERPAGGVIDGLLPLETTLLVEADGYAVCEVPLGTLASGTQATAEARLERGATLTVTVLGADGEPAAGANVSFHPFAEGFVPGVRPTDVEGFEAMRAVEERTLEDATGSDGTVTFDRVTPGEYGLFAELGDLTATEESFEVGEGADARVTLRLPESGALAGRITGIPAEAFAALRAETALIGAPDRWPPRMRGEGSVEIDAEGRFLITGLLPCEHTVRMRTGTSKIQYTASSGTRTQPLVLELGTVTIEAGVERSETFDASAFAPGRIVVEARVNGEPARGLTVLLSAADSHASAGGTLDVDGEHVVEPAFPGTWTARIWPLTGAWRHQHPDPVELAPGGDATLRIDIETGRGRLLVRDAATGEPAAGRTVFLDGNERRTLDDDGVLEAELPTGSVGLSGTWVPFGDTTPPVSVLWGPEGPNVDEVSLSFE